MLLSHCLALQGGWRLRFLPRCSMKTRGRSAVAAVALAARTYSGAPPPPSSSSSSDPHSTGGAAPTDASRFQQRPFPAKRVAVREGLGDDTHRGSAAAPPQRMTASERGKKETRHGSATPAPDGAARLGSSGGAPPAPSRPGVHLSSILPPPPTLGAAGASRLSSADICSYLLTLQRVQKMSARHALTQRATAEAALSYLRDTLPAQLQPRTAEDRRVEWTADMAVGVIRTASVFGLPLATLPVVEEAVEVLLLRLQPVRGTARSSSAEAEVEWARIGPPLQVVHFTLLVSRLLQREQRNREIAQQIFHAGEDGGGVVATVAHNDDRQPDSPLDDTRTTTAASRQMPAWHDQVDDDVTVARERPLMLFYSPGAEAGQAEEKLQQVYVKLLLPQTLRQLAVMCSSTPPADDGGVRPFNRDELELFSSTLSVLHRATAAHLVQPLDSSAVIAFSDGRHSSAAVGKTPLIHFARGMRRCVEGVERAFGVSLRRRDEPSAPREAGAAPRSPPAARSRFRSRRKAATEGSSTESLPNRVEVEPGTHEQGAAPTMSTGAQNVNHDVLSPILLFGAQTSALDLFLHHGTDAVQEAAVLESLRLDLVALLQWSCQCISLMRTRHLAALATAYNRLVNPLVQRLESAQGAAALSASARLASRLAGHVVGIEAIAPAALIHVLCHRALSVAEYFSSSDAAAFLKALSSLVFANRMLQRCYRGGQDRPQPSNTQGSRAAFVETDQVELLVFTTVSVLLKNLDAEGYSAVRCPSLIFAYSPQTGAFEAVSRRIPRFVAKVAGHPSRYTQQVLSVEEAQTVHSALTRISPVLPEVWMKIMARLVNDVYVRHQPQRRVQQLLRAFLEQPTHGLNLDIREGGTLTMELAPVAYNTHLRYDAPARHEPQGAQEGWRCRFQRFMRTLEDALTDTEREGVEPLLTHLLHSYSTPANDKAGDEPTTVAELLERELTRTERSTEMEAATISLSSVVQLVLCRVRCQSCFSSAPATVGAILGQIRDAAVAFIHLLVAGTGGPEGSKESVTKILQQPRALFTLTALSLLTSWAQRQTGGESPAPPTNAAAAPSSQRIENQLHSIYMALLLVATRESATMDAGLDPHDLLSLGNLLQQEQQQAAQEAEKQGSAPSGRALSREALWCQVLLHMAQRSSAAASFADEVSCQRVAQFFAVPTTGCLHDEASQRRLRTLCGVPEWLLAALFGLSSGAHLQADAYQPASCCLRWALLPVLSRLREPLLLRPTAGAADESRLDLSAEEGPSGSAMAYDAAPFCAFSPLFTEGSRRMPKASAALSLATLTALLKQWCVALVLYPRERLLSTKGVLSAFVSCLADSHAVARALQTALHCPSNTDEDVISFFGVLLEGHALLRQAAAGRHGEAARGLQTRMDRVVFECCDVLQYHQGDADFFSFWRHIATFSSTSLKSAALLIAGVAHWQPVLGGVPYGTVGDGGSSPPMDVNASDPPHCTTESLLDLLVQPYLDAIGTTLQLYEERKRSNSTMGSLPRVLLSVPPVELLQHLATLRPSLLAVVLSYQGQHLQNRFRRRPRQKAAGVFGADAGATEPSSTAMTPLDCLLQVLLTMDSTVPEASPAADSSLSLDESGGQAAREERVPSPMLPLPLSLLGPAAQSLGPTIARAMQRQRQRQRAVLDEDLIADEHLDDEQNANSIGQRLEMDRHERRRRRGQLLESVTRLLMQPQDLSAVTPMTIGRLSLVLDSPTVVNVNKVLRYRVSQLLFHCFLKQGIAIATATLAVQPSPHASPPLLPSSFQSIVYFSPVAIMDPSAAAHSPPPPRSSPPAMELSQDLVDMMSLVSLGTWQEMLQGPRPLSLFWASSHRKAWNWIHTPKEGGAPHRRPAASMDPTALRNMKFYHSGFIFLLFLPPSQLQTLQRLLGPLSFLALCRDVLQYYVLRWIGSDAASAALHDDLVMAERQNLWLLMEEWNAAEAARHPTPLKEARRHELLTPRWCRDRVGWRDGAAEPSAALEKSFAQHHRGLQMWHAAAHNLLMGVLYGDVDVAGGGEALSPSALRLRTLDTYARMEREATARLHRHRAELLQYRVAQTHSHSGAPNDPAQPLTGARSTASGTRVKLDVRLLVDLVQLLETVYYDVDLTGAGVVHLREEALQLLHQRGGGAAAAGPSTSAPSRSTRLLLRLLDVAAQEVHRRHSPWAVVNAFSVVSYWSTARHGLGETEVDESLRDELMRLTQEQFEIVEKAVETLFLEPCHSDAGDGQAPSQQRQRYEVALRASLEGLHTTDIIAVFSLASRRVGHLLEDAGPLPGHHAEQPAPPSLCGAALRYLQAVSVMLDVLGALLPSMRSADVVHSVRTALTLYQQLSPMRVAAEVVHDLRRFLSSVPVLCANDVERFELAELVTVFAGLYLPLPGPRMPLPRAPDGAAAVRFRWAEHSLVSADAARSLADYLVVCHDLEETSVYTQLEAYRTVMQLLVQEQRPIASSAGAEAEPALPLHSYAGPFSSLLTAGTNLQAVLNDLLTRLRPSLEVFGTDLLPPLEYCTDHPPKQGSAGSHQFINSPKTLRGDDTRSQLIYFLRLLALMEVSLQPNP